MTTPGPDPANHDHQIVVEISNNDRPIPSGNWRITFRGVQVTTGRIDAWVVADNTAIFTSGLDDGFKVGSPGCASSVITVASFTTRNVLVNQAGRELHFALPLDAISTFSSGGPLRNGALKPDVAAPGAIIVSARSADAKGIRDDDVVAPGFMRDQGTSMATPFISGLVALLPQANPAHAGAGQSDPQSKLQRPPTEPPAFITSGGALVRITSVTDDRCPHVRRFRWKRMIMEQWIIKARRLAHLCHGAERGAGLIQIFRLCPHRSCRSFQ